MAPGRSSSQNPRSFALSPRRLKPIQGAVAAVVLGIAVSVLGTIVHQTRIMEAPFGVGLALGLVLWASLTLRSRARKFAGWIFTGVIAILITAFAQKANDVMIPATDLGYAWTYGAIAVAAVITAFPNISSDLWAKKL
jgi:hypothetical protein